ncbi:sigma intracellular receptor 2-like [Mytilus californianus]|uniref:sigma intracellular receptor 2-like n=1 Tax=Mytilus californianus TaxID=6549 RepID=UPI00224814EC|nr:sigma intracellular receptor 2-like [Mytilus californianus]
MAAVLDFIFLCYFITHIPISIFVDAQVLLPKWIFPTKVVELKAWYCAEFKDTMMIDPPAWFRTFVYCEFIFQFPFFFVAVYAFIKGIKNCSWIRTPMIVYSTHVATTTAAICFHIMYNDFSKSKPKGPKTQIERQALLMFYFPYLLIPLLMLTNFIFRADIKTKQKIQ